MCILGAVPFAACGFFKYHGMTAEKLAWAWLKSEFLYPKKLIFKSDCFYYRWRCSCTGESSIKKGSRESIKSGNEFGVFACSKKVLNYNWCEKLKDCKKGVILS